MTALSIVAFFLVALVLAIALAGVLLAMQHYTWFHMRLCKYCHHTLEYKGLKDDDNEGHYLFHCPKCGAWEQVLKEEFFRDIDKGFNPNEFSS